MRNRTAYIILLLLIVSDMVLGILHEAFLNEYIVPKPILDIWHAEILSRPAILFIPGVCLVLLAYCVYIYGAILGITKNRGGERLWL